MLLNVILVFSLACNGGSEVMENTMSILRKEKLLGYDRNSRPVKDHSHNTPVYLGMHVVNLDINDQKQTMVLVAYLSLTWNDEYLRWNPEKFNNISTLHFDADEIWIPDIALINSANGIDFVPKRKLPLYSLEDGNVSWITSFTAEVPCRLDFSFWPSDKHTCALKFASSTHHGDLINLKIKENDSASGISFNHYNLNNKWLVLNHSGISDEMTFDAKNYDYIEFEISIQRRAAAHSTYVTQTTLALMLTVLASFFLPIHYHLSRLLLHMMALSVLIICNFVLFLSLPSSGGGVPFVVSYFSGTIVLTTMSLICNVAMTTSFCSDGRNSQSGIKKKLISVLGISNTTCNERANITTSSEVAYSNLEEELRDMSDLNSTDPNILEDNPPVLRLRTPATSPAVVVSKGSDRGMFRVVNGVLFFLFGMAFVIDYIILRSAIKQ